MLKTKYELRFSEEDVPIAILHEHLEGRVFDFVYELADGGGVVRSENLRLQMDCVRPIRICTRGRLHGIVFSTTGSEEDPFVSMFSWDDKLVIDFSRIDIGVIRITNFSKDWFEFRLKPTN